MTIDPKILAAIANASGESQSEPVWVKGTTKAAPDSKYSTLEQLQQAFDHVWAGRFAAADFHQRHQVGRIEPVGVHEALRLTDHFAQLGDQKGRRG